jgi:hypothetical protein
MRNLVILLMRTRGVVSFILGSPGLGYQRDGFAFGSDSRESLVLVVASAGTAELPLDNSVRFIYSVISGKRSRSPRKTELGATLTIAPFTT